MVLDRAYALHDYGEGWYVKGGILDQFLVINKKTNKVVEWMGCSRNIDNLEMLGISKNIKK